MTANFRALLAALVLIVAAAACALFVGYRTGLLASRNGIDVATTGNVSDLFQNPEGSSPPQLIDIAVRDLENKYYKPVDPQAPIAGEKAALTEYLHSKKIAASFPSEAPSDDASTEGQQLA